MIPKYTINLHKNPYNDKFHFEIKNNNLIVKRLDTITGWSHSHSIDICILTKSQIYLFKEIMPLSGMGDAIITNKDKKILDARDPIYYKNSGW